MTQGQFMIEDRFMAAPFLTPPIHLNELLLTQHELGRRPSTT
jgi:hypothetical protein